MLRAENLGAFRGERLVFTGLSFQIPAGGSLVLSGPNGAGKSTLLRILAGLVPSAAGRVYWGEADALTDRAAHAARVAYVAHQDAVKPGLTAAENLRFAARLSDRSAAQALDQMDLGACADLPAKFLSAGQKRRLALARLSLSTAPLWLLDEPTVGLDEAAIRRLGDLFAGHLARAGVIAAATHAPLPLPDSAHMRLG